MALDVVDLRSFYTSPLGDVARRLITRIVRGRWDNCAGQSILGLGYATPYLDVFRQETVRTIAFMPAEQGVMNWPLTGMSATALVDTMAMPLPDSSMDRVLVIHALEITDNPRELLSEIWRILTPGGQMMVIAPNRGGLWARVDTTPFGHGQPYSRGQMRDLMRGAMFTPVHFSEALYMPPFERKIWLKSATAFERFGTRFSLPGAGVLMIEATKQVYSPVMMRRQPRRISVALPQPLAPVILRRDKEQE